jgi:RNA polymerase sigma-B factor
MTSRHLAPAERHAHLVARSGRGDERARDTLVRELLPMADRIARRFASPHHPEEDLAQVAGIGLLKAIDRFEPGREAVFTTYAHALMTGEVRRHLRDARLMRVPRPIYEQVPRFQRALDRLTAGLGREPTRQELADELGITKEDVIEIADAALTANLVSLDSPLAEASAHNAAEHDGGFEQVEAGVALQPLLRRLSPRERMVLDLRFDDGLSQSEIAAGLGLSQTQVSRILRRAIAKLSEQALTAA